MAALVLLVIPMIYAFRPTDAATLTFPITADATIKQASPNANLGSAKSLETDNSPVTNFVLKFTVSGTTGSTVTGAKLRLYNTHSSASGGSFHAMADTSWNQKTITWANAPAANPDSLAILGAVSSGSYVTVDISTLVKGDGTYSIRVDSNSPDDADYGSMESNNKPQVVVTTQAPTTSPTAALTATPTESPTATPAPTVTVNITPTPTPVSPGPIAAVSASSPCVGSAAPAQWKHVVVLMFENKTYSTVINSGSAPFITDLVQKCGTYTNWKDANFKVNGTTDGNYISKPHYATLTSGVSPSVHGLKDDTYSTVTSVDNIFNRLRLMNVSAKVYQPGAAGQCATSNFSGAYHDALRYYTNLGGKSSTPTTYCNMNDVSISSFMTDVNSGNLPAFSMVLPTNSQNMHDNSVSSGDSWASSFLTPLLDSDQYKSGDTAIFFLWDEDTPIPNVMLAPSIRSGSSPAVPTGNPISHFSALRTWQEMLGVSPLLGDTGQAPSLLNFYNGQ